MWDLEGNKDVEGVVNWKGLLGYYLLRVGQVVDRFLRNVFYLFEVLDQVRLLLKFYYFW